METLEEVNLSHIYKKFKNYDVAAISASRASYNRKDKRNKNTELRQDLMNSPYEVITTQGGYPEEGADGLPIDVKERSFFVVNGNPNRTKDFEDFMFNLCAKYDQDSIFLKTPNYRSGLYNRNRELINFGDGDMVNLNKLNSDPNQPYYSRINGSKFSFEKESVEGSEFEAIVKKVLREKLDWDDAKWNEWAKASVDKWNEDQARYNGYIDQLNKTGQVSIPDKYDRQNFELYCYSDTVMDNDLLDFDPNELRFEGDLVYLA